MDPTSSVQIRVTRPVRPAARVHYYNWGMAGRQCYHCKQWVEQGEAHDCWTTTEAALTQNLSDDLQDAWERLRETAVSFGDQRIYASHKSIMFARKVLLFLRASEEEFPRSLRLPWTRAEGSSGAARRSGIEVQSRACRPDQASGRGRGAHHRLASRSVQSVGRAGHKGPSDACQIEAETWTEEREVKALPSSVCPVVSGAEPKFSNCRTAGTGHAGTTHAALEELTTEDG